MSAFAKAERGTALRGLGTTGTSNREVSFHGDTLQPFTCQTGRWPNFRTDSLDFFGTKAQGKVQGKEKLR